jgi:hypothetical protein
VVKLEVMGRWRDGEIKRNGMLMFERLELEKDRRSIPEISHPT